MHALFVVSLWIHIVAAATWVGGSLFLTLVLVPALRHPAWRDRALELIGPVARRFLWVVWTCFAVLLVTGGFNLLVHGGGELDFIASSRFWSSPYGRVLAWKLLLVGSILVLSALHDFVLGPRAAGPAGGVARGAGRLRLAVRGVGRLNLLLGLLVVGLGVALGRGWPW
jgi:uncharacterized membrane protein